jgi:hypothetical protein
MTWDKYFTGEDEKNDWMKTKEEIRNLPPWEFTKEKYEMLRASFGMFPYAKKAYKLFKEIEKERDDIVETNIFKVFPYPLPERPYYCDGSWV